MKHTFGYAQTVGMDKFDSCNFSFFHSNYSYIDKQFPETHEVLCHLYWNHFIKRSFELDLFKLQDIILEKYKNQKRAVMCETLDLNETQLMRCLVYYYSFKVQYYFFFDRRSNPIKRKND
jgi:hypothetical protein